MAYPIVYPIVYPEKYGIDVEIMIFNIDGGSSGRAKKKILISKALHEHNPDFVLVQELIWRAKQMKKHVQAMTEKGYEELPPNVDSRESILYIPMGKFVLNEQLKATIECGIKTGLDRCEFKYFKSAQEFNKRSKIAAFSLADEIPLLNMSPFIKYRETRMILISWHGPYKISSKSKLDAFEDLMKTVNYLKVTYNIPVVVGGDFNIALDNVIKNIISKSGLQTLEYELKYPRTSASLIDFFVITPDIKFKSLEAKPFDLPLPDLQNLVFDHTPVIACLEIPVGGFVVLNPT